VKDTRMTTSSMTSQTLRLHGRALWSKNSKLHGRATTMPLSFPPSVFAVPSGAPRARLVEEATGLRPQKSDADGAASLPSLFDGRCRAAAEKGAQASRL